MNKEIFECIECIQKVYPNTLMQTIYQAVYVHSDDYVVELAEVSDQELLACLRAEIHTIMNG